ncbi:MAG: hypothetical protein ABI543_10225 [Ignavibacteria bacterium]
MNKLFFLLTIGLLFIFSSCDKKPDEKTNTTSDKKEFGWKDNITAADIPDIPVKGFLGGKEVQFAYINFEKWRGANDNVINFSLVKPAQNCGFIENFEGFTILNKGSEIKQGPYTKSKFADDPASYQVSFKQGGSKSGDPWNMALEIESITDKSVKGKIALFFNDSGKSWLAGKFEAVICNN